ncbi:MAG: phage tail sheath family protein, partial [Vicinamibacterales bacterium]
QLGLLYRSLNLFYANGGAVCYVVSVGPYAQSVSAAALKDGVVALEDQVGPTMLVVPDMSLLPKNGPQVEGFRDIAVAMLNQCRDKQDRVALFDVVHAQNVGPKPAPGALAAAITQFRADVDHDNRDYGIAYMPDLHTSIIKPADIKYTMFERSGFIEFILNEATKLFPNPRSADVQTLVETLRQHFREGVPTDPEKKKAADTHLQAGLELLRKTNPAGARKLEFLVTDTSPADVPGNEEAITTRDQNLTNAFPALAQLDTLAARRLNRLPAAPAMAGIMTTIDGTRGVWNAPANIALTAVIEPTIKINNDEQADLNKPIDGKAINVVREFVGRGTVVWGARTLDGNSNDHRYVQVRRTLIYIEQSIRAALNQFVFASNDGKTWVAVTSMVSNFLNDLWAKGGLMGATPKEAFSVECGLGTTMTGRDVLEGYMVVQVLVQLVHPAEFIELTFKQKMEGVG